MTAIRLISPWARGFVGRFARRLAQGQHQLQCGANDQQADQD
jgi:hypothetical protein